MELSYEEAKKLITDRLNEYPEIWNLYSKPTFETELLELLIFLEIDTKYLPLISNEILITLAFYSPIRDLPKNICETTGVSLEKAEELVLMLNTTIFDVIKNELLAFDYLWFTELEKEASLPDANKELKEKLELRPQNSVPEHARPLTREAVAQAIAPSRTMAGDIRSATRSSEGKWESEKE